MPEDRTSPGQPGSDATLSQPRVDASMLERQERQFDSPAVNLARPKSSTAPKEKLPPKPEPPPVVPPPEAPPPVFTEAPPDPPPQPNRRLPAYLLIGLVLLGLAGAGVWWVIGRSSDSSPVVEEPIPLPGPEPAPSPLTVVVDTLSTEETEPLISGRVSEPATEVLVTIDGVAYAAAVDGTGGWEVQVDQPLKPGTYDVAVRAEAEDSRIAEDDSNNELTVLAAEPQPEPTPEPEPDPEPQPPQARLPEEVPDTGPGDSLPNTGPGGSRSPQP